MHIRKKSKVTKNYVRRSRIVILFVTLFFTNVFSQQIKSDTLVQKKESTSQFSKSEIIVTNGAFIYDPSNKLNTSDDQLKGSKPIIYVTEGTFIYAPKNSVEVSIVKVVSNIKKISATKVLANKAKLHHKIAVENKSKRSLENRETYRSSDDDSNFTVGNIAKTVGIFYNTSSKSKKAIQFFKEFLVLNNFRTTLKANSQYSFSLYIFRNCECYFTRPPPPYFS